MHSLQLEIPREPIAVPPIISLLSEHLDQVLAAGEDLLKLSLAPVEGTVLTPGNVDDADELPALGLNDFVRESQRLELAVAMRVLRAREYTRELKRADARFKTIADLFLGGTNPLTDSLDALAQPGGDGFETGDCPVGYLRSRGVIAEDAGALPAFETTDVGEDFRVGGVVETGQLMDLVAAFLDAIEIHYDVFPESASNVAEAEQGRRSSGVPQLAA
ncbi:MAG: hypothetical protein AAGC70_12660 [Pseudomonadota bacterium]